MVEPKKWGVKECRARNCPELQRDPEYPDSPQMCAVTHGMPGSMSICVKEMPPEQFIRHISAQLNYSPYPSPHPGPRNCPKVCPYKIEKGMICAFTGEACKNWGVCPCNVLGNPKQKEQIQELKYVVEERIGPEVIATPLCTAANCPDGLFRNTGQMKDCPVIHIPFKDLKECPLWRIPAKLLQVPAIEAAPKPTPEPDQNTEKPESPDERLARGKAIREEVHQVREEMKRMSEGKSRSPNTRKKKEPEEKQPAIPPESRHKPAEPVETIPPSEKKRAKKEKTDPICEDCRNRYKEPIEEYQCAWCKREQEKHGRRGWTTTLQMGEVHLGDMNVLGKQIPADSIDLIFTDPAYVKDQYQQAYADLAELALRVLKPNGFLITYAPQTHLDEIMDMLRYNGTWLHGGKLQYFWIIESLNEGQSTAKNHQRNAICLHKPILVFQKAESREDLKGARRCFADVVRGFKQKRFHPWQQSVHDVLGIIDRFMVPGEILLDPYAGIGTSLIAANLLGMDWIGFEIDPETHAIAVRELQQQPIALEAFGIEAPAAECERELLKAPKDTSKQAPIAELGEAFRKQSAELIKKARTAPPSAVQCLDSGRCEPGADHKSCYCAPCLTWDTCQPAVHPEDEECKIRRKTADELPSACQKCEALDDCPRRDPKAGCLDAVKAIQKAQKDRDESPPWPDRGSCNNCQHSAVNVILDSCPRLEKGIYAYTLYDETEVNPCEFWGEREGPNGKWLVGKKPALARSDGPYDPDGKMKKKPRDHGTGGGPQPFVQHCCGTCGHHKGRKTFHESCPRLGELMFKGGEKSAKVLMEETASTPCEHWTEIPGDLYTTVHYDGKDLSPSLGTCPDKCPYKVKSKSSCGFTDQQFLRMESCPTGALQSSPEGQKCQLENMARALARLSAHLPSEDQCQCFPCPDGVIRCGIGDKNCPFSKNPFDDLALCPMQNPRRVRQILRERPLKFVKIEKQEDQPAEKPNCGGKRPAISRCPDNCLDRSIEKEGGYPQGRCKQTGQKLREMQACPNDPPKKIASKKPKKESETA